VVFEPQGRRYIWLSQTRRSKARANLVTGPHTPKFQVLLRASLEQKLFAELRYRQKLATDRKKFAAAYSLEDYLDGATSQKYFPTSGPLCTLERAIMRV